MKGYWFGVHKFWGWYPITWHAWAIIATMVLAVMGLFLLVDINSHSLTDTLITAFPPISLTVTATIFIALLKGEKPLFGRENQHKKDYSRDDPKVYIVLPIVGLFLALYYLSFDQIFASVIFIVEAFILYIVYKELVSLKHL